MSAPIVVGVDTDTSNGPVLEWAADEARLRNRPVRLVHASLLLVEDGSLTEDGYRRLKIERAEMLARACTRMLRHSPGLEVDTRLAAQEPGEALVAESEQAELIVIGARGIGGFEGLLVGSVGLHAAAHAHCPVMVVPAVAEAPTEVRLGSREVVVGVDERHRFDRALGWAFTEADLRGAPITAIYAIKGGYGSPGQAIGEDMELSEALAGSTSRFPDVAVTRQVSEQPAGKALVAASEKAALVVVGARRRRGHFGMALGRVNHVVLHHARCPVVVVPDE